jgi:hypothetical protein
VPCGKGAASWAHAAPAASVEARRRAAIFMADSLRDPRGGVARERVVPPVYPRCSSCATSTR